MGVPEVYDFVKENYNPKTQLTFWTVYLLVEYIYSKNRSCNILVFGLGKDSAIWKNANKDGYTLFVEDSRKWVKKVCGDSIDKWNVLIYKYPTNVKSSLRKFNENVKFVEEVEIPEEIKNRNWDLIIIDAPNGGNSKKSPGRSIPIAWTARIVTDNTLVIVDDYRRPLEKKYSQHFLVPKSKKNTVIRERNLLFWIEI